ncbi:hypothetical protein JCM10212_000373 [Sporobolomyces blumeae]
MAFQHPQAVRKRESRPVQEPAHRREPARPLSSPSVLDPDDDEGVVLFGPASPASSRLDWSVVHHDSRPILSRGSTVETDVGTRSIASVDSWRQHDSSTEAEPGGDGSSSASPRTLDHSLLPSHDGNGVFLSDSLLFGPGDAAARGLRSGSTWASTDSSRSDRSSSVRSRSTRVGDEAEGWALTEAALSKIPHETARGRRASRTGAGTLSTASFAASNEVEDDFEEGESSAGLTEGSSSENERSFAPRTKTNRHQRTLDDLDQSVAALSAGIAGSSRNKRKPFANSTGSPSSRNRLPFVPIVGPSQRSLSPYFAANGSSASLDDDVGCASSLGGSSSGGARTKRRHRRAGRTASSAKRNEVEKGRPSADFEAGDRSRASRLQEVVRKREKENEIAAATSKILLGNVATTIMSIDPSSLPLIAESTNATPVPSRAQSPTRRILAEAKFEHVASSFDAIGTSYLEATSRLAEERDDEDEGAMTETEGDDHRPRQRWVATNSSSPPVFAPRVSPSDSTRRAFSDSVSSPLPRSHSTTSIPSALFPQALMSPLDPRRPALMRRSSSYTSSPRQSPLPLPFSRPLLHPAPPPKLPTSAPRDRPESYRVPSPTRQHMMTQPAPNVDYSSHEERIMLAPPSETLSSSAWGGDFETLELALSYWKRFLRSFQRGLGGRTTTIESPPLEDDARSTRAPSLEGSTFDDVRVEEDEMRSSSVTSTADSVRSRTFAFEGSRPVIVF